MLKGMSDDGKQDETDGLWSGRWNERVEEKTQKKGNISGLEARKLQRE